MRWETAVPGGGREAEGRRRAGAAWAVGSEQRCTGHQCPACGAQRLGERREDDGDVLERATSVS